ncbi:MAG: class I SAM-dependent methyltransferase [Pseudomonadota bacterium]
MIQDLRTIYRMIKPTKGADHEERLENFYSEQSTHYDDFRKKLLLGREHLFKQANEIQPDGVWVDFGAGTGSNLDFLSDEQIKKYDKVHLVDLSESLLKVAQKKVTERVLSNVQTVQKNGADFQPGGPVDLISFSYSLTMIPQWYQMIHHAYDLLSPGGTIAVVDFYISEKYPLTGLKHHGSLTRHFWPIWFSYDNVFLSQDHLPYLLNRFEKIHLFEGLNRLPYLPLGQVPYYSLIAQKGQSF